VTNHHRAASVLKWAVWEMDRRYRLLHANHARNIVDFNKKVEEKRPLKGPRETLATQAGIQRSCRSTANTAAASSRISC